jgi:hypothetical protein
MIIWTGYEDPWGQLSNAYKILRGKPEGKRHRHRYEFNIRIDLRQSG